MHACHRGLHPHTLAAGMARGLTAGAGNKKHSSVATWGLTSRGCRAEGGAVMPPRPRNLLLMQ